jgi:hypothetical protein
MKPIGGWSLAHRPHPEEARSAVSKDGRRLGLACGRPVSLVAVLRDARKSAVLRTRLIDASI